jgi:mannosyltransferase OCH1-like enzyme
MMSELEQKACVQIKSILRGAIIQPKPDLKVEPEPTPHAVDEMLPRPAEDVINVFQSWKTTNVPDHWKNGQLATKQICQEQGWNYIYMDDEANRNLIATHYAWFLPQYDAYEHGISRADAVRYFYLYHYPGFNIYFDLDMSPKSNFPGLVKLYSKNTNLVVTCTDNKTPTVFNQRYTNAFMMSRSRCTFWPDVVWPLLKEPFKMSGWKVVPAQAHYFNILMTTGSSLLSDAIQAYKEPYHVIPHGLVQPLNLTPNNAECTMTELPGDSWHSSSNESNIWKAAARMVNHSSFVWYTTCMLMMVTIFVFSRRR